MNFLINGISADAVEQAKIERDIESYSQEDKVYFFHYKMMNAQAYSNDFYYWKSLFESAKAK